VACSRVYRTTRRLFISVIPYYRACDGVIKTRFFNKALNFIAFDKLRAKKAEPRLITRHTHNFYLFIVNISIYEERELFS